MNIVIKRILAAGDLLQALPIASALTRLGHQALVQTDPKLHFLVTRHGCNPLFDSLVDSITVDLDGAYENHPDRKKLSFRDMYIEAANRQLQEHSVCIDPATVSPPRLRREWSPMAYAFLSQYQRPWVMIAPRACTPGRPRLPFVKADYSRDGALNRTILDEVWSDACGAIQASCFWLGIHAKAPRNTIDVETHNLHDVVRIMDYADTVATVDTGPMHIACALGIETVVIKQSTDPVKTCGTIYLTVVQSELDCLACNQPVCHIDSDNPPCQRINPVLIANAVNEAIA